MEILTGEQMRRIDRRTIEQLGVPGLQLMESAGRGVAECLLEDYPSASAVGVLILCGKGNNGGDGLVIARYMARHGVDATVILLAEAGELRGDAAQNLQRAREAGIDVQEVPDEATWSRARSVLDSRRIVVDALLGTGVRGGARGLPATVIEDLNRTEHHVASVDLPSGINADLTEVEGCAVRAERTYTLCRPKIALVFEPAASHAGVWSVVPIGIPDEAVAAEEATIEWLDAAAAGVLLRPRAGDSHKGTFGHLLAVAGSRGKSGAAVLLARGALRCGVGLVTVAAPDSSLEVIAAQQAELMTEPLPETGAGGLSRDAADVVLKLAEPRTALAVGPGLGTTEDARSAVRAMVAASPVPLVVDADGLNALAPQSDRMPAPVAGVPAVLTPHPGEAARLLEWTTREIQTARQQAARQLALATGATVVLKGNRTLIAGPDGRIAVNSSGNPGMASAGTGDVLTGAVGALLARGLTPWDAACLAVFVHGDAGDRAAAEVGEEGMIASDLVARLPTAFAALRGEMLT